jgi:hypothetical protein
MKGYNMKKPVKIAYGEKKDVITTVKEYELDDNFKLVLVKETKYTSTIEKDAI